MPDFHFTDEGVPLLCQLCGDPIGVILSPSDGPPPEQPDPNLVVSRCYSCAATEEAEAILKNDAGPYEGNSGITPEHRR